MVAGYKQCAVWHDGVDTAAGGAAWLAVVVVVWVETLGVGVVVYGELAVFDYHVFAGKRNDAFDDVLVLATERVVWIFKHDNLTTFWDVVFVLELCRRDGEAIDDESVARIHGGFHARANYREGAKNKAVNKQRANCNTDNEDNQAEDIA